MFVRLFHWTLVAAFTIAYFTEDDLLKVHVTLPRPLHCLIASAYK